MITGIGGITFTTTNKIEWIMKHGSVTSPAAQTAVEATDIVLGGSLTLATGGIIWALTAAHAAAATNLVEYIGGERYVSIVPTFGGTHATGTPVALLARGSHARLNPPA